MLSLDITGQSAVQEYYERQKRTIIVFAVIACVLVATLAAVIHYAFKPKVVIKIATNTAPKVESKAESKVASSSKV